MHKFRKKPVVIEAIKHTGIDSFLKIMVGFWGEKFRDVAICDISGNLVIMTLEGEHKADKGDWIIKGVKDEFYPCKPDIFETTYEKVE